MEEDNSTIEDINVKELREVITNMLLEVPQLSPHNSLTIFTSDEPNPEDFTRSDKEDLGIFTIEGSNKLYSHMTYTDHERVQHNPYNAAKILISKAVRRMSAHGIVPKELTINLNHIDLASPEHQLIASQIKAGVKASADIFNLHISNQKMFFDIAPELNIPPTLIISMVGIVESEKEFFSSSLMSAGNTLFIVGKSQHGLDGSEYQKHHLKSGFDSLMWCDINNEKRSNEAIRLLIKSGLIQSANPVGIGGIFFSLLRSCYRNDLGFSIVSDSEIDPEMFLFEESMGRYIVGVKDEDINNFVDFLKEKGISAMALGDVTTGEVEIDDQSFGHISMISTPQ